MHDLWSSILRTSGAKVYSLLAGLLILALTARWVGPEGRGVIAAITAWVNTFSTIGYLSLGQVAIHRATQARNESWLPGSFSSLAFFALLVTITGWGVAFILYSVSDGEVFGSISASLLVLGFALLPLMLWEQYGSSLLMALERLDIYNKYLVVGRTATVIVLVMLWLLTDAGIAEVFIAIIIGQTVISGGGIRFIVHKMQSPVRIDFEVLRGYIKDGLKLHLNAIGALMFTTTDVLMLNYFRGAEETGYYQLALQFIVVMLVLPQAATMVLYGKVSNLGPDRAWCNHRKLMIQVVGIMALIAIIAGVTAGLWLVWFAGEAFRPAIGVFHWLLLTVVGMTFSTIMAPQWIGRGFFWQASALTLVAGVANIVANIFLIPRYGMYGAVWASLGTYSFAILGNGYMCVYCNKKYRQFESSAEH